MYYLFGRKTENIFFNEFFYFKERFHFQVLVKALFLTGRKLPVSAELYLLHPCFFIKLKFMQLNLTWPEVK